MSRSKLISPDIPLSDYKLLTREEAATYCRVGLSTIDTYRRTVWRDFVVSQGYTGGRIFFDRAKIDRWLERGGMERRVV